jgi:rSAM/selenodomain-associated transferase 1
MKSALLFVKYPRPGRVKSRLARDVGTAEAAALYRRVAEETVRAVRDLPADLRKYVFFTPPEEEAGVRAWLGSGLLYRAQEGDTLGQRLQRAFETAFSEGAHAAAAIGSDTLELTSSLIVRALDGLCRCDVVVGPAKDGGYYLIGLKEMHPALFCDMPWSRPELLKETLSVAERLKLSVLRLPTLCDLDRVEDIPEHWR